MEGYDYDFTVFTPTYNRAQTLHRVYESLRAQTFRDFEWLIVDDGSTDHTEALVKAWQAEADFPIRYVWQANGGKCRAINRGVLEARGELFLTLDSDDACVPQALERLKHHWGSIPEADRPRFSGVTALVQSPDGTLDGTRFPFDPTDSDSLELRAQHGVKGEKWGFHRTHVMRRFPFPEFEGERYVALSVVWRRIAREYKTRYVNEPLRIRYSTPSSLSRCSPAMRAGSPRSARLTYRENLQSDYPMPLSMRLRNYSNYTRFSFHAGVACSGQVRDVPSPLQWAVALPVGALLYLRDRMLRTR